MKYIKLFEAFSKDYMKKIDLKDFKKIKIGAKFMYMGGKVEVLDNNGYVLKLKGEDDRIFMVNKSQFDHGGMTMRESVDEGMTPAITFEFPDERKARQFDLDIENSAIGIGDQVGNKVTVTEVDTKWRSTVKKFLIKNKGKVVEESVITEGSDQQRLTHLRKFGIAPNNQPQNGAYIKSVSKPGKFFVDWKDAFDLGDVALEFVKSVGSISEFDIIDLKTMKRTGKQLDVKKGQLGNLRTTYGVRVNESSAKDGGDKSNGNSHHEHHLEEDIEAMWKKTYGENFSSKYPAVAKIVKQRKIKDKRELKRIWDETYGENFEEQYPALWQKMD